MNADNSELIKEAKSFLGGAGEATLIGRLTKALEASVTTEYHDKVVAEALRERATLAEQNERALQELRREGSPLSIRAANADMILSHGRNK